MVCHCKTAQEHYRNMKEDYNYQVKNNFPLETQIETYRKLVEAREAFDREVSN